jgi:putative ABC transport system substrate-binding protein
MTRSLRKVFCAFVVSVLFFLCFSGQAAAEVRIAILMSDSLTSTLRTMHGAKKVILRKNPKATFHTFHINRNNNGTHELVDSIRAVRPTVLLTIGSASTKYAQEHFPDIPIVFAAVKYPVLSGFVESIARPGKNITGASIDVPTGIQFKYFKMIVPRLKRVGVLYTSSTAPLIPSTKHIAQQEGLTLVPIKINSAKELPRAMDSLAGTVEGIWSLADPNLFDPQTTRFILLNTLRKGIPFMGFSRNVVESGALFALDFDYKAVGRQAGRIVNRIINGEKPGNIRVTSADVIWFHYNEKTAKHINVQIPEELAAVAKEVYR